MGNPLRALRDQEWEWEVAAQLMLHPLMTKPWRARGMLHTMSVMSIHQLSQLEEHHLLKQPLSLDSPINRVGRSRGNEAELVDADAWKEEQPGDYRQVGGAWYVLDSNYQRVNVGSKEPSSRRNLALYQPVSKVAPANVDFPYIRVIRTYNQYSH